MKLFFQKPNTLLTNVTLFVAATLVAAWSSPLLLVDATEIDHEQQRQQQQQKQRSTTSTTTMMVDSHGTLQQEDNQLPSTTSTPATTTVHHSSRRRPKSCPSYGCPLLPRDMFFDKEAQAALQAIRSLQPLQTSPTSSSSMEVDNKDSAKDTKEEQKHEAQQDDDEEVQHSSSSSSLPTHDQSFLSLFYNEAFITNDRSEDQATLTLIGYKGGELHEQINQDRAFVISPFYVYDDDSNNNNHNIHHNTNNSGPMMRLLGVFDGHAKLGEKVSEYSVQQLPQLLSSKLQTILLQQQQTNSQQKQQQHPQQQQEQIQNAINDTFIEVDKTAPAQISGGCTASIILQIQSQIYVANAGDSRSFVATYNKNTHQTSIVYITREDKPDIPEERQRVENAGGQVYIPPPDRVMLGASSRVVYVDKHTGNRNGLAMSRSIGDWAAGELGVIPNPKVEVLDIQSVIDDKVKDANEEYQNRISSSSSSCSSGNNDGEEKKEDEDHNNLNSCISSTSSSLRESTSEDIEVFAVSATDGLLDFVDVNDIAKTVANSLYIEDSPHPLSACESLITTAASSWWKAKNGRYRDDIAIAVSKLSLSS